MIRSARRLTAAVLGVLPFAGGCYYYVPVASPSDTPPVGEHVAFDLTDHGRAELADRLGPGVLRVEGTLTREEANSYTVHVWRVSQIGETGAAQWSGEVVTINRDFVGSVLARKLSQQKTIFAAAAATGGLLLIAKTAGLVGSFGSAGDTTVTQPPTQSRGWW